MLSLLPLLVVSPVLQQSSDRLVEALPTDSIFVLTSAPWDEIRERAGQNAWIGFLSDDTWSPLLEEALASMNRELAQEDFPCELEEVVASIHGGVALAATLDAGSVGLTLMIDAGSDSGAFADVFAELWRLGLEQADGVATVETYRDVALLLVEESEADGSQKNTALFQLDGLFALLHGDDAARLRREVRARVDALRGGGTAGAERAGGAALGAALAASPAALLRMAVDMGALVRHGMVGEPESEVAMLEALGLTALDWAFVNVGLGQAEAFDMTASMGVPADTLLGEFVGFLGPLPRHLLPLLPAEAASIHLGNYDLFGAWQRGLAFAAERDPQGMAEFRAQLEMFRVGMNLDVERDLLGQISGDFAGFSMPVPAEEAPAAMRAAASEIGMAGFPVQGSAFLLGLEQPETVQGTFRQLMTLFGLGPQIEEDELGGQRYYRFANPVFELLWAFTSDGLLWAQTPTVLRTALAAAERKSGPSKAFAEAVARCGEHVGLVTVSDTRAAMQTGLQALRALMNAEGAFEELPAQVRGLEWSPEALANKYFAGTMVQTLERRGDALTLRLRAR